MNRDRGMATVVGDVTYGDGRVTGSAFVLDGAGDYIDLGTWSPQNEWTLAAWVNPTEIPDTNTASVGIVGIQADFRDWAIGIFEGKFFAAVNGQIVDSGIVATTNVWTHVAATYRDQMVHIYVDGVLRNSANVGGPYVLSTSGVRIGSTRYNNAGFFTGRIDEVSIVERSVSDAEIISLRDDGTIDFVPEKDRFLVTFDSPLIADSVAVDDFSLSGPTTIGVESVQVLSDRSVEVTLTGVIDNAGNYTLAAGPEILGVSGFAMDQDLDGTAGEPVDDVFNGSFIVDRAGPRIVQQSPEDTTSSVLTSVTVTFNEPIDPATLRTSDVQLLDAESKQRFDNYDPTEVIDGFLVHAIAANSPFTGLSGANRVLADPIRHATNLRINTETINFGSSVGNFGSNQLIPLSVSDYFVLDASATITIPTAGKWTFAAASDEGYRLEIGDFAAEFPTGRPLATDLHVFDFPAAGDYPLRMVMFETIGAEGFELSAAEGELTAFDAAVFKLVGDIRRTRSHDESSSTDINHPHVGGRSSR